MADPSNDTFGYEEQFQRSIVAAALKDPAFLAQNTDVLLPGYLDYEYLSSILRTARELTERLNSVPSKMTMVEEVKAYCEQFKIVSSDREFILNKLEELYAIDTTDIEYIRERVVDFGQRQSLRAAVLQIVTLFNSKKNSTDVNDQARSILEDALRVGMNSRDLGMSLYPSLERLPELAAKSPSGLSRKVPTMIPTLDQHTHGGPGRGEVWVVAGMPGRGKSTFLVNIGVAGVKNGHGVVHFTIGDLNEVDTGVRYAARLTMCTTYEVISGSESYLRKARKLSRYDPHLHIKYYPSATATMGHLRAYLSKLSVIEEFRPAIIIIDYPEELRRPRDDNLYLSGEENYAQANALAAEFEAVVWLASQPKNLSAQAKNYNAKKGVPNIIRGEDMGESWRKFQKVDGFCSWNMTYEEELQHRARLWVDKTRRDKSFYLVHMETSLEHMLIKEGKPPADEEGTGE